MANAIQINGGNVQTLTDEQRAAIAAILGVSAENVKVAATKATLGKLEGKLVDNHFKCECCGSDVDYAALSEEEQINARKTGVCVNCHKVYEFVKSNKTHAKGAPRIKNAVSNGELCRAAFIDKLDLLTEDKMKELTSPEFCKDKLKLRYALFAEVTGMSKDEKTALRLCGEKSARFAALEYTINGKKYVCCNDLYERHVPVFEAFFAKYFEEAAAAPVEEVKKSVKSKKAAE